MANGQRKKVGALRSTGAAVLGSVGVFMAMAGLGMQSWPLGGLGAAMVVLAVALLFSSTFRGADRAFVVGTAHVLEINEPPASLTHGRGEMHLQIEAPGHPPASVRVRDPRIPVAKWPEVGDVVPVRVATDDIRRVRVLWDEILTRTQRYQSYGDPAYDGVTDDRPLYDDQGPDRRRVYADDAGDYGGYDDDFDPGGSGPAYSSGPGYSPDASYSPDAGYSGDAGYAGGVLTEEEDEGPPLPQRNRPRPRPRPRRSADEDAADPDREPLGFADPGVAVLEGELVAQPLRVDAIDFSEEPSTADGPGTHDAAGPPADGTDDDLDPPATAVPAAEPTTAEPTTAEPTTAEPTAAEPTRAEPTRAEPTAVAAEAPKATRPEATAEEPEVAEPNAGYGTTPAAGSVADSLMADRATDYVIDEDDEDDGPLAHEDPLDLMPPAAAGSGTVHGVGITMLVADVGRSVAFYRDLLGFHEIDSGRGNAVLASGDTRIVLRMAEDLTAGNRRLTHLNLEVGDLDGVYRELLDKGIVFTYAPRVVNRGERLELWAAAFRDPDGHAVNLTQWRTRS